MTEAAYVAANNTCTYYSHLMTTRALNEYEQQLHESACTLLHTYNVLAEKSLAAMVSAKGDETNG